MRYQKLQQQLRVQSFSVDTGVVVLPVVYCTVDNAVRCSNSAQKSTVWMCQVTDVVTETTHLVLTNLKPFYHSRLRIEYCLSLSL